MLRVVFLVKGEGGGEIGIGISRFDGWGRNQRNIGVLRERGFQDRLKRLFPVDRIFIAPMFEVCQILLFLEIVCDYIFMTRVYYFFFL